MYSVPAELQDDYIDEFQSSIQKSLKPYIGDDPIKEMSAELLYARCDKYGRWHGSVEVTPDLCTVTYTICNPDRPKTAIIKYTLTRRSADSEWELEEAYLTPWTVLVGDRAQSFALRSLSRAADALLDDLPDNAFIPLEGQERRTWYN